MTGTLTAEGLTSLAAGDFVGLSGITTLTLRRQRHRDPACGPVRRARISHRQFARSNVGLTHLPKDILPRVSAGSPTLLPGRQPARRRRPAGRHLRTADEADHSIRSRRQPGRPDSFRTAADAGPGGMLSAGQTVTLGGPGTSRRALGVERDLFVDSRPTADDMLGEHGDADGGRCREAGFHCAGASRRQPSVKLKFTVIGRGDDLVAT